MLDWLFGKPKGKRRRKDKQVSTVRRNRERGLYTSREYKQEMRRARKSNK